jgi:transcriptional regulator with XRE-family HTH domain
LIRLDTLRIIVAMGGKELLRIRKRLGLTQTELAAKVGVARNSIARQERGELGIRESLARLLRLLVEIETKSKPTKPKGRRA